MFPHRSRLILSLAQAVRVVHPASATALFILFLMVALASSAANAQYTQLYSFAKDSLSNFGPGSTGDHPRAGVISIGSTLYGATSEGGVKNGGTLYSVDADGSNYRVLHQFATTAGDGWNCGGPLTVVGSSLFGTTYSGGGGTANGTLFRINADGTGYSQLHAFTGGSDGYSPSNQLTAIGSTLYGTCRDGGAGGAGTIFKVNADGTGYSTVFSFSGGTNSGPSAGLTLIGSALYGTTFCGGQHGLGNIFRINPDGTGYTDLYDFANGADGEQPFGKLLTDGSYLYGVNSYGGAHYSGVLFRTRIDGSGFKVLHNNCGGSDRAHRPTLVGSTLYCPGGGDANGGRDIFQINTDGTGYQEVYVYTGGVSSVDYGPPNGDMLLMGSTFYGTTDFGGVNLSGALFSLVVPEPSTLVLLGLGAVGVLGYAWRRLRG